jgi:hypothetical protein
MKKFTEQERADIFAESCRLLEDEPPVMPPAPTPEPPPLVLEDALTKWRREADEAAAASVAARAKLKSQSQARDAGYDALMQHVAALERRLVVAEQSCAAFGSLANGCLDFSNAVSAQLREFDMLTKKLEATLSRARAAHQREVDSLRTQLMAHAAMHTREIALLTNQLTETKRALDQANAHRERTRDREHVAALGGHVENVVQLLREDIAKRNNGAA